jgi:hypothetical protein
VKSYSGCVQDSPACLGQAPGIESRGSFSIAILANRAVTLYRISRFRTTRLSYRARTIPFGDFMLVASPTVPRMPTRSTADSKAGFALHRWLSDQLSIVASMSFGTESRFVCGALLLLTAPYLTPFQSNCTKNNFYTAQLLLPFPAPIWAGSCAPCLLVFF